MASSKNRVGVFVRVKPTDRFASETIELLPDSKTLTIHTQKEQHRGYINNQVLDWRFSTDGVLHNASQEEVYAKCASRLVELTLDGYNNTLFAYGQTGSGKTYTMSGANGNFQHRGIIPRAISQLYKDISHRAEYDITVRISYLEIYKDKMYDLLCTLNESGNSSNNLTITEDDQSATYVKGLSCPIVRTEEEALNLLFEGETNRTISEHMLNRHSSRSHCIFTIYCESHSKTQSNTKYTTSKFNFVDLAGSERLAKTQSEGKTQEEARYINTSLTFLEQAVIALEDKKRVHVPYRQCVLTHLLKDSLGGKCSTVMIGNIWGEESQLEETLSTLRFASRVMNIQSQPAVNTFFDPILLCKQYEKEINTLRKELAMYDTLTNRNQVNYEPLSDMQINDVRQQVRRFIDNDVEEIDIVNTRQVQEVFTQFKVIVNELEAEMERRLKEVPALVKVPEPVVKANEKPAPPPKTNLVGESDGSSFNVGKSNKVAAQPSAIVTARKKTRKRKDSESKKGEHGLEASSGLAMGRPTSEVSTKAPSALNVVIENTNETNAGQTTETSPERPASPPSKEVAFTIFKSEQGHDLNLLFQENKDTLNAKKREAKEISESINRTKEEIDATKAQLDTITAAKEKEEIITINGSQGEIYLDEDEFELITKLKSLKNNYRTEYDYLQSLRSDFAYCESMVKRSRQKLLSEFDVWYADAFGVSPAGSESEKAEQNHKSARPSPKDEGEKFENVKTEWLMKNPDSIPYYNALSATERRKLYSHSLRGGTIAVLPSIAKRTAPLITT